MEEFSLQLDPLPDTIQVWFGQGRGESMRYVDAYDPVESLYVPKNAEQWLVDPNPDFGRGALPIHADSVVAREDAVPVRQIVPADLVVGQQVIRLDYEKAAHDFLGIEEEPWLGLHETEDGWAPVTDGPEFDKFWEKKTWLMKLVRPWLIDDRRYWQLGRITHRRRESGFLNEEGDWVDIPGRTTIHFTQNIGGPLVRHGDIEQALHNNIQWFEEDFRTDWLVETNPFQGFNTVLEGNALISARARAGEHPVGHRLGRKGRSAPQFQFAGAAVQRASAFKKR
jgi:hypothetical protein